MNWFKKKRTEKRLKERVAEKHRDYMRPVRIMTRLKLRVDEAADKKDLKRMETLLVRIRKVRDFQIAEWGF